MATVVSPGPGPIAPPPPWQGTEGFCWGQWSEQDVDNVLRTEMDSGTIKSRRRFTGRQRLATVSVQLPASRYKEFIQWFRVTCQAGVLPALMDTPYGDQEPWAFAATPQISWPDRNVFRVSASIYQLPGWI